LVILIAPIGLVTEHIKTWLQEVGSSSHKLWLLHSKKNSKNNFPLIASKLEKDLLRSYRKLEIKKKEIKDAFSVNHTIDIIHEIILNEEETDPSLIRRDFVINITGGTNAMGAAALLAATLYGTKAHYVREPQKEDPKDEKYVDDLPVFPIAMAKLNENQLKVLKIISESDYEIEGGPAALDKRRIHGSITRTRLLKRLCWDSPVKTTKFMRREGNTRLLGITKKLEDAGLIMKVPYTERYVNIAMNSRSVVEGGVYTRRIEDHTIPDKWILKRNDKELRFEITSAGRRRARDTLMF
jgi:hypothetical protein